jgi:osmoprotectant transport system substrate-binding protein
MFPKRFTRKSTGRSGVSRLLAVLIALVMVAAACGDDDDDGGTTGNGATGNGATGNGADGDGADGDASGRIGEEFDLSDASFTVGSKEFTEQLILGHITRLSLEATGADVGDEIGLQGSTTVRNALTAGDVDMYWEYLGTGWVTHLGNEEGIPGVDEQYEAVRDADADNDITWLEPTPFNNTYAIAVSDENAEGLEVSTVSDLGTLIEENPDEATFCAGGEFATRPDGLPGLEETYGFEIPTANISNVQDALVYQQVDAGDCNFGSIFATDGRVAALGLTVLEDDEQFFPPFNASLNVRSEVIEQHPELEEIFGPIAEELDDETMTGLNAMVDVDGEEPEDVAEEWLVENGHIAE